MSDDTHNVTSRISFGRAQSLELTIQADRVIWQHYPPAALDDLPMAVQNALAAPIDFPALSQAVIPDDRVVIAVETSTPGLETVIAGIWNVLSERGVEPENLTILQPSGGTDPRTGLPEPIRGRVIWKEHNPTDKDELAYLASTTSGERIHLARLVTDADVVLSVGRIGFDPVLGFSGTNSAFYPQLSDADAIVKARGQGHIELEPEDSRPLRQVVDEVGWLLGSQFTVQTVPAASGGVAAVLAGAFEPVFRRGREFVTRELLVTPDTRSDLVVVSITDDAAGHGWAQIGAAIAAARRLVVRDGKILVLSQLSEEPGPGLQIIQQVESAADAIKPLRLETPIDLIPATQISGAVEWADVYLLSELDEHTVEELFMIALGGPDEAIRLIESTSGSVALLEDAHNVHARIAD